MAQQPLPRRRAVQLLGGALAVAAVPALHPRSAKGAIQLGTAACGAPCPPCGGSTYHCCIPIRGNDGKTRCKGHGCCPTGGDGYTPYHLCCKTKSTTVCCNSDTHTCGPPGINDTATCKCKKPCGAGCCRSGETCSKGRCICKKAQKCGASCCGTNEICMKPVSRSVSSNSSRSVIGPPTCCSKSRLLAKNYCCPPGNVLTRTGTHNTRGCCPANDPNCCPLGCRKGDICINGRCEDG